MLQFVLEFTNIVLIPTFCVDMLYPRGVKHSLTLELDRRLICGGRSGTVYYTTVAVPGFLSAPGSFQLLQFILLPQGFPSSTQPLGSLSWSLTSCVISINWARYHHAPHVDNHSSWGFRREQRIGRLGKPKINGSTTLL